MATRLNERRVVVWCERGREHWQVLDRQTGVETFIHNRKDAFGNPSPFL